MAKNCQNYLTLSSHILTTRKYQSKIELTILPSNFVSPHPSTLSPRAFVCTRVSDEAVEAGLRLIVVAVNGFSFAWACSLPSHHSKFIWVLFKHFYSTIKAVNFSGIRTQIVGVNVLTTRPRPRPIFDLLSKSTELGGGLYLAGVLMWAGRQYQGT